MANRAAPALVLRAGDREELSRLMRSSSVRAGLAQRARIVLLAADGVSNTAIAERIGVSRPTVIGWRDRYLARGIAGLEDEQRPGRPRRIDHAAIVTATLSPPPTKLGVTHWSTRLLGKHLGISDATVAKAWRNYGIQPWRAASFRFSTDPELVAKVVDVVGLYLAPPENAIVLSIDEKSQIQALERSAPILPTQPGLAERRSHDYIRHGTSTLFAALEVATGKVTAAVKPRHRHQEFLAFLKQLARAYPGQELHLVMDNYSAHKHDKIRKWLAANPRVIVHFTPTHASWMNLVEVWFSMIERQAIHRGSFASVRELNAMLDDRASTVGLVRRDEGHPRVTAHSPDHSHGGSRLSRRATSAAAATTRGPMRAASNSPKATTPTLAATPLTPCTGAATPCAPACSSPSVATNDDSPARPAMIARPAAPRSSACLDPTRYAT
jgi:transposase